MQGPSSAIWTGLFCKEVNIGQQREDANEKLMLNHAARRPRTCMNHDRAARAAVDKGGIRFIGRGSDSFSYSVI